MDVVCPQCGATYELSESQIPGESARVKCSSCEHIFRVHKHPEGMGPPTYTATTSNEAIAAQPLSQAATASGTSAAPVEHIVVRSANGVISHIPDQATLQRMVVERKLAPTDELSYDGNEWHNLGSLSELQPFFQLLVAATPSQANQTGSGSVLISGQTDPTSTLEFGLPSPYDPSIFPPSRPGMPRADGAIRQETERYQQSSSGAYSSDAYPVHIGSQDNLSYRPRAPIFSSPSGSHALPSSTELPYDHASSERFANSPDIAMEGVSFTTLEPRESTESPNVVPVQVKLGQDQTRIPTMITRSDDDWPIGSAAQGGSQDNARASDSGNHGSMHSGAHSSPHIEPYFVSHESMSTRPASKAGRWFALVILVLGLGVGGYSLFNPDIFGKVANWIGLSDSNPSALQHVREAREIAQQATPTAFAKAHKELALARKEVGQPFTAYLASKATVELLQVDVLDLRLSLLNKKLNYWKKQLATLKAKPKDQDKDQDKDTGQDEPDNDSKAQDKRARQIKALSSLLQNWEAQGQQWRQEFNRRWQTAKNLVGQASQRDPNHPYTMIARLHLRSLSRAANSSRSSNDDFQKHYSRILDRLEDRGLQGWVYLHGASVSIRHKKYDRGLGLIRNAVKYSNHPNWLYPRLLGAWVWVEKGNPKKAEVILSTIDKNVSEHPRVSDFREVLNPPSLETLLASYGTGGTTPPTPPRAPTVADGGSITPTPDAGVPPKVIAPSPPKRRIVKPRPRPRLRPRPKAQKQAWTTSRLMTAAYTDCYRGNVSRGLRRANQALQRVKNGYSYATIGWCYLQQRRYSRALQAFHNAARYSSRRNDTYYGLGLSYLSLGQKSKACEYFKRHLRSYPRHMENGEVRALIRKHKCQ